MTINYDDVLVEVSNDDITTGTIKIPNGVKKIGDHAFSNCLKLIGIDIPKSVKEIGVAAFEYCRKLEKVNLTYGITKISSQAFEECELLENITIPNSVTEIGNYAFIGCVGLKNITLPNSVTKIGHNAFNGCKNLNNIIISESVEKIGAFAFSNCKKLKNIILPDKLNTIESYTFLSCENLKKVVIPPNIKCIKDYAFKECYRAKLVLTSTLINFNINKNHEINAVQVGRTLIKSIEKFEHIRKKEILNEIKKSLKIKGINNKGYYKNYFKYEYHEYFIKMMLNELNKDDYIDFNYQLDNYMDEFLKIKGLKIEKNEIRKDIPLKYDDELKKEENLEYTKEPLLQENPKRSEIAPTEPTDEHMSNERIVEDNPVVFKELQIKNIKLEKKEELQKENDIKEILKKLSELPTEDISIIMDMVKNNLFDKNIINYMNMSREEKIEFLNAQSQKLNNEERYESLNIELQESNRPKVSLKKEPIEEYKARQKVKH